MAGVITGYYGDGIQNRGYVRFPHGMIVTFDPPDSTNTYPQSINSAGSITGYYRDASFVSHGFIRALNGSITTFDAPDAGMETNQGTFPFSINSEGAITGYFVDANSVTHGFVLEPHRPCRPGEKARPCEKHDGDKDHH